MNALPDKFIKKLEKVAEIARVEKRLSFLGLVHHDLLPQDRWDVIVSADSLVPWSTSSIAYVAGLLRKELTDAEIIKIAQVVALPRDNGVIRALTEDERATSGRIRGLHPADQFDDAIVIWSERNSAEQMVKG